jgi:hypothetical protein
MSEPRGSCSGTLVGVGGGFILTPVLRRLDPFLHDPDRQERPSAGADPTIRRVLFFPSQ